MEELETLWEEDGLGNYNQKRSKETLPRRYLDFISILAPVRPQVQPRQLQHCQVLRAAGQQAS